ncbi:MAG: threonine/serine exporter family protein [Firmicutes bacterium]|nr:threonine/serine exporter family protein [Bacillota bacterium]
MKILERAENKIPVFENRRELTQFVSGALDLGEELLISGAEVARVEDTIKRLCTAYGAESVDVFTITSSVIVTADFGQRGCITQTRRIAGLKFNLSAFEALNDLSRRACSLRMEPALLRAELNGICGLPKYTYGQNCGIWALIASSFCLFFGGNGADAFLSGCIAMVLFVVQSLLERLRVNGYFSTVLCSLLGGFLSNLAFLIYQGHLLIHPSMINIGIIMLLIPGIALTNSIRDMFSGDTISGLLRFIEALVLSVAIAWGFAVLASPGTEPMPVNPWLQLGAGAVGSLGFSLLFNVRGAKRLFWCAVGGGVAWGVVLLVQLAGGTEIAGYLAGSLVLTIYAEIMARLHFCPSTVYIATATIPLIPGGSLYNTMRFAMDEAWSSFAVQGLRTLGYAILISAGILIIHTIMNAYRAWKKEGLL